MFDVVLRMTVGSVAVVLMALVMWGFRHAISPVTILRTFPRVARLLAAHLLHLVMRSRMPAWALHVMAEDDIVRPSEGMRISVTAFHLKTLIRIGWWDVWVLASALVMTGAANSSPRATIVNVGLGLLACVGSLFALWALHGTIPKGDRHLYSLFTAPFYPWAWLHRESALRRAGEPLDDPLSQCRHDLASSRSERNILARHILELDLDLSDPAQERLRTMALAALAKSDG
jgi:hypothetical protein